MRSWEEVHRLHREGLSERAIARKLNASRNTVHRLLNCPVATPYGRNSGSLLNPFKHCIASLLEQDPTMPATVVKRHLDALGYAGGISILREHLAAIRPDVQASHGALLSAARPVKIEDSSIRSLTSGLMDAGIDNQPGMNLISSDFDIMMVNRTNERLFRKPAKEMLGKKCYEEFERRVDVCPHCPGAATLATGQPHSVETWGIRDDGTKYRVRITAYPIPDPRGDLLGFVELEEDITEQSRRSAADPTHRAMKVAL